MYRTRVPILALVLACAASTPARGAASPPDEVEPQRLNSGPHRVTLVELYTSEGCSSCPPADRWLSRLVQSPGLWRDFVPVSLHVDYWDDLGWPDRFASADYSERQRRYAAEGGTRVVYTPGVFRNGREWRAWRDTVTPAGDPARSGELVVTIDGQRIDATYTPVRRPSKLMLHLALLGLDLASDVAAGENRGRRLEHDFVALALRSQPMLADGDAWHATAALPASSIAARRYAIAAWVTSGDSQAPVQATGGFLRDR